MNSGMGALREKAKLLDTVLDTMDQGLMMIDAAGVVQVCNARALTLLDLPPALMRPPRVLPGAQRGAAQRQAGRHPHRHLPSLMFLQPEAWQGCCFVI